MKRLVAILVVLTLACSTAPVPATTAPKGVVQGIVSDSMGATLPGVTITLFTTPPRTAVTDEQGTFQFIDVPAGSHEVRAELAGFGQSSDRITVAPYRARSLQMVLRPYTEAETITVAADTPSEEFAGIDHLRLCGGLSMPRSYRDLLKMQPKLPTTFAIDGRRTINYGPFSVTTEAAGPGEP
jgi:hypothetical protein